MPERITNAQRSAVMAAVPSSGNKSTEMRLASALRAFGVTGWRRHYKLLGRPDFTFSNKRVTIFVDGCFWHGCRQHCRMPNTNRAYWDRKIARNRERDKAIRAQLNALGWTVLTIWEHELKSPSTSSLARKLRRAGLL